MENIYLFELDSVIISEKECRKAQEKLYMELMNGNRVILSLNQTLSTTFFDLLDINQTKYTTEHIQTLIKKDRICVAKFGDFESPQAYIASKMGKDAPEFKYSCMRFLNRYDKESELICDIKAVLVNNRSWHTPEKIKADDLTPEERKLLFDYINVIKHLDFEMVETKNTELPPYEYYIKMVCNAVIAKGFYNSSLKDRIADDLKTVIENLRKQQRTINRSTCITELENIQKLRTAEKQDTNLAKAILEISYNYQVENSIECITRPHSTAKEDIAKIVEQYCHEHDFSDICQIEISKKSHILAWNAVADFCDNADYLIHHPTIDNKKRLRTKLCGQVLLRLSTIAAMLLLIWGTDKIEQIPLNALMLTMVLLALQFTTFLFPFTNVEILDLILAIGGLYRCARVYCCFIHGKTYSILVTPSDWIIQTKDRLIKGGKHAWLKVKNIFH